MNTNTAAIVRLAWTRGFGLPDESLSRAGSPHLVPDDDAAAVRLIRLWDASVLTGPPSILARIDTSAAVGGEDLTAATTALARAVGATRPPTTELLGYLDAYGDGPGGEEPLISHDDHDAHALTRRCPPDDVNEAAIDGLERNFTVLDDAHTGQATAGYATWQGLLADVRVLSAPPSRRRGLATAAARIAAHDALDDGLVPQARIHPDNHGARRLALRLGFVVCGRVTRVPLSR